MRKFVVIFGLLLLIASTAFAQEKCQDLRALYDMNLFVNPDPTLPPEAQGGWFITEEPIRAILDQQGITPALEMKVPPIGTGHGVVGHDNDAINVWHFDNGTFTTGNAHAVYPNQPGKAGLWRYNGTSKISDGTGDFEGATGTLTETGPYIVWVEFDNSTAPCVAGKVCIRGKYFATIIARICKP